jgi:putative restriction endonuclease
VIPRCYNAELGDVGEEGPRVNEALLERFSQLRVWTRGQETAVHKPLLILYALGQLYRHGRQILPFEEIDEELTKLLSAYGPARRSPHTSYPFWRLQRDGVWAVSADSDLQPRASNTDPKKTELLSKHATGGFPQHICSELSAAPEMMLKIAENICRLYFKEEDHSAILHAVDLS